MENDLEKNAFPSLTKWITHHFAWVAFSIYASGFLMWNYYLSHYGFFEYNLVQIRFLSAGLLIWLPVVLFVLFIDFLLKKIPQKYRKIKGFINYLAGVLIGLWFPLLWIVLFPQVSQVFGGAKPIPVSIIGTPEQIDYLTNFAIGSGENAQGKKSVQTYPVCLIYQNDQYILFFNASIATSSYQDGILHFGFSPRVISISRSEFLGFQEVVGADDIVCGLSGSLYNGLVKIPTQLSK